MSNILLTVTFLRTSKKRVSFWLGQSEKVLWFTWDLNLEERRGLGGSSILEMCHWWLTAQNSCLSKDCQVGPGFRKNCKQRIRASIVLDTVGETGIMKIIVIASEDLKYYWGRELCKSMAGKTPLCFVDSYLKVENSTLFMLCNYEYEFC